MAVSVSVSGGGVGVGVSGSGKKESKIKGYISTFSNYSPCPFQKKDLGRDTLREVSSAINTNKDVQIPSCPA